MAKTLILIAALFLFLPSASYACEDDEEELLQTILNHDEELSKEHCGGKTKCSFEELSTLGVDLEKISNKDTEVCVFIFSADGNNSYYWVFLNDNNKYYLQLAIVASHYTVVSEVPLTIKFELYDHGGPSGTGELLDEFVYSPNKKRDFFFEFISSFDCSKASTRIEKMVCGNKKLSEKDRLLSYLYLGSFASTYQSPGKTPTEETKKLTTDQSQWMKSRNLCKSVKCVADSYDKRIKDICTRYKMCPQYLIDEGKE